MILGVQCIYFHNDMAVMINIHILQFKFHLNICWIVFCNPFFKFQQFILIFEMIHPITNFSFSKKLFHHSICSFSELVYVKMFSQLLNLFFRNLKLSTYKAHSIQTLQRTLSFIRVKLFLLLMADLKLLVYIFCLM